MIKQTWIQMNYNKMKYFRNMKYYMWSFIIRHKIKIFSSIVLFYTSQKISKNLYDNLQLIYKTF